MKDPGYEARKAAARRPHLALAERIAAGLTFRGEPDDPDDDPAFVAHSPRPRPRDPQREAVSA